MNRPFYGLVLAGGKSTRMGRDKALLQYHDKPQREYLVDLLSHFCSRVFISVRKKQEVPHALDYVVDQGEEETPLNGIVSALTTHKAPAWLTVPVDMPNINNQAVELLIQHRNREKLVTCFLDSEGTNPDPLFAIWEKESVAVLKKFYQEGGTSAREFLRLHPVELISAPDKNILLNINTELEWNKWIASRST